MNIAKCVRNFSISLTREGRAYGPDEAEPPPCVEWFFCIHACKQRVSPPVTSFDLRGVTALGRRSSKTYRERDGERLTTVCNGRSGGGALADPLSAGSPQLGKPSQRHCYP